MTKNNTVEQYLIYKPKKIKKPKFGLKELFRFVSLVDKIFRLYDKLEPKIVSLINFFIG